jgi:hypothetical protein
MAEVAGSFGETGRVTPPVEAEADDACARSVCSRCCRRCSTSLSRMPRRCAARRVTSSSVAAPPLPAAPEGNAGTVVVVVVVSTKDLRQGEWREEQKLAEHTAAAHFRPPVSHAP